MTTQDTSAPKRSTLRKFIEYLGRGATPVDGYWVDSYGFDQVSLAGRKAAGMQKKVSAPLASTRPPRLDKCAPAAPGT